MCVGKALTGGYLSLAAVLCTGEVARGLSASESGVLMHGPTYMGNPLACSVALASLDLLESPTGGPTSPASAPGWSPASRRSPTLPGRGRRPHDRRRGRGPARPPGRRGQGDRGGRRGGVWLRPFRDLIYTMPPYVTSDEDVARICAAIERAVAVGMTRWEEWLAAESAARDAAGLQRSLRPRRGRGRDRRPGRQRLPRPGPRPAVVEAAAAAARRWGAGRRCLAAGHRARWSCTPSWSASSRRTSGSRRRWCSRPATTPTSPPSPRSAAATHWWSPTRTCTPRWSTPSGWPRRRSRSCPTTTSPRWARRWPRAGERRALVLVESVYSVLGDEAPLVALAEVCERHDALLVVDEAHGLGVRGPGLVRELGLAGLPHVAGHRDAVQGAGQPGRRRARAAGGLDHLVNRARPFIFDTGLAPASAGAALEALRQLRARPELSDVVRRRMDDLSAALGVPPSAGAVLSVPMPARRSPSPPRPRRWRRASSSAASGRRRCPTGSRGCGSRSARASRSRTGSGPSTCWSRWSRSTLRDHRRDRDLDRGRQDRRHGGTGRHRARTVLVVKPVQTGARRRRLRRARDRPAHRRRGPSSGPRWTSRSRPTPPPAGRASTSRPWRRTPSGSRALPDPDRGRRCRRAAGPTGRRRRHAARPRRAARRRGTSRWWSWSPPGSARSTTPS